MPSKRASNSKRTAFNQGARPVCRTDVPLLGVAHVISTGERAVMKVFYSYLMTPGHMLCLNSDDCDTHDESLNRLVQRGLLRAERFPGGYALTVKGYDTMRSIE